MARNWKSRAGRSNLKTEYRNPNSEIRKAYDVVEKARGWLRISEFIRVSDFKPKDLWLGFFVLQTGQEIVDALALDLVFD
jgi:hypothetical protein